MNIIKSNKSFTLVELLVVVALIAVLAVAVIISLNPSELLKQGRDSRRLSDLQNLNKSLSLFEADTGGTGFMGSSSVVYVSVPDTSPTCSNLGLPPLPEGWPYHCVTEQNLQKTDGSGWIPVNFNQISFRRPISKLPIDPINQTSTGEYYTYVVGGSWELNAMLESEKYSPQAINDGDAFPGVYSLRTSPNPLTPGLRDKGLVGYWSFDEGSGTVVYDYSGNNNHGTLTNGPTWTQGKVGGALSFDGVNDYVNVPDAPTLRITGDITIVFWMNKRSEATDWQRLVGKGNSTYRNYGVWEESGSGKRILFQQYGGGCWFFSSHTVDISQWYFIAAVRQNLINGKIFINDMITQAGCSSVSPHTSADPLTIGYAGFHTYFPGLIDEVRIYNRALSGAEIQAIYNATK